MAALHPELLSILCHPHSKGALVLNRNRLLSQDGSDRFRIQAGIPSLLTGLPLRHRVWQWVYNRLAFGYDLGVRLGWRLPFGGAPIDRQSYLEEIEIRPGDRVLETAVGTGANILLLPDSARYFGVDLSMNMLHRCQGQLLRRQRTAHLVHADMQALPFKDNSFDVVFHMGGLQFTSNPSRALVEMLRTARRGSSITVVDELDSLYRILRRARPDMRKKRHRALESLLDLVPVPLGQKTVREINQGELFLLKFRKPEVEHNEEFF